MSRTLRVWLLTVVLSVAACHRGVGGECDAASDCRAGLLCDPATRTCQKPATSDAAAGSDAMSGTDATVPSDAAPGSDSSAPFDSGPTGTDAVPSGTDATAGCSAPPAPTDPLTCYAGCIMDDDCTWVDSDCCCACSMGGSSVAINSAYAAEWTAHQSTSCAGIDCTMIFCPAFDNCPTTSPGCVMGQCM
jgi:hypothetical protein